MFGCTIHQDNDSETSGGGGGGRRSRRARTQTVFFTENADQVERDRGIDNSDDDDDASEGVESNESSDEGGQIPMRRKSSRSTAFRGGMREPSDSVNNLYQDTDPSNKKSRGARQAKKSSLQGKGNGNESESDEDMYDSPPRKKPSKKKTVVKSPAKRHTKRRMSKRVEYDPDPESSEEEMSEDEESGEEEEENEMKFNKLIACKSMTLKEWKTVCAKMNTSETTNGSRWIQEEDTSVDPEIKYEERYLVKWDNLSFLHCSWETEKDLVEFCEGAKARISTFFRKQVDGCLYEPDERLDGVSNLYSCTYHSTKHTERLLTKLVHAYPRITLTRLGPQSNEFSRQLKTMILKMMGSQLKSFSMSMIPNLKRVPDANSLSNG